MAEDWYHLGDLKSISWNYVEIDFLSYQCFIKETI